VFGGCTDFGYAYSAAMMDKRCKGDWYMVGALHRVNRVTIPGVPSESLDPALALLPLWRRIGDCSGTAYDYAVELPSGAYRMMNSEPAVLFENQDIRVPGIMGAFYKVHHAQRLRPPMMLA